jgi:hypothetical protein
MLYSYYMSEKLPDTHLPMELAPPIAPNAVETRNMVLEGLLNDDPSRPLPQVTLQPQENKRLMAEFDGYKSQAGNDGTTTTVFDILTPTGERVGTTSLNQPGTRSKDSKLYIGRIGIVDGQRHQGYGPAAYLEILKALPEGRGLRTEGVLSPDAVRVWEKLVSKGLAKPSTKGGAPTGFETTFG